MNSFFYRQEEQQQHEQHPQYQQRQRQQQYSLQTSHYQQRQPDVLTTISSSFDRQQQQQQQNFINAMAAAAAAAAAPSSSFLQQQPNHETNKNGSNPFSSSSSNEYDQRNQVDNLPLSGNIENIRLNLNDTERGGRVGGGGLGCNIDNHNNSGEYNLLHALSNFQQQQQQQQLQQLSYQHERQQQQQDAINALMCTVDRLNNNTSNTNDSVTNSAVSSSSVSSVPKQPLFSLVTSTGHRRSLTEREKFLIFVKILFKFLDQTADPRLKPRAKAVVTECTRRNRLGDSEYTPLQDAVERRLRHSVGEFYWTRAKLYFDSYCQRRGLVEVTTSTTANAVAAGVPISFPHTAV